MSLGLFTFCERIAAVDRGQIPDRGRALVWLAEELHRQTGAAVAIWLTELVGGSLLMELDTAPTRVARAPGESVTSTVSLRDLTFFGETADLLSEAPSSDTVRDGPIATADCTLADGERAILFRGRLEFALCWVRVSGPRELLADPTPWRHLLPPAIHGFLRGVNHDERLRFRGRQEVFFDELLIAEPRKSAEMFGDLCLAWHTLAGSKWAWLWLFNPISGAFELTASASDKGKNHPDDLPPGKGQTSKSSVAAYASLVDKVIPVPDSSNWHRMHNGQEYKVAIPEVMAAMEGGAFICVPIIATLGASLVKCEIRGSVCLHFAQLADMPSLPFKGLRRMGQATAQAIVIGFMSRRNEILLELNEMAGRTDRNPIEDRAEYLKKLIDLLQNRLHFRMISVFYRVPFQNSVECLASTGLCRNDGTPVPPDRLSEARYAAGERRTGKCFADCQPLYFPGGGEDGSTIQFTGNYYEVDPVTKELGHPFVLYPIPDPAEPGRAMGVIRCVSQPELRNRFLEVELEPLAFIAQQVGVALQALDTRIRREQTISIVKHDLSSPLTMISHTVDRVREDWEAGLPMRDYDLANLDNSSFFATNLASQLDVSPGQFGDFDPEPTFLEGDILARVVNMLRPYAWDHRRIQIVYDKIRVIPQLNVDRSMVERAIHNLLVNAIKYGDFNSTVLVEGRKTQAGYCLDVKNHGIGIEPEETALIGQLNYRSPKAKLAGMGLGFGLYIARAVMIKHGGELDLTKNDDPTTFTLLFPVQLAL